MKKAYIAPVVDLDEMNGEDELLSASPSLPIDPNDTLTDDSQVGSKLQGNSLWGDDEEE